MTKLNVGCGTDYRAGFINIDGSTKLPKIDKLIDISHSSLLDHFNANSIEFILANDIVEHHFHWEAVRLFKEFHALLMAGGIVEIRVPDAQYIVNSWRLPMARKITLLFGGQDIPQRTDAEMDVSRETYPQFFCHKYGWTKESMKKELEQIGFSAVSCKRVGTNLVTKATK